MAACDTVIVTFTKQPGQKMKVACTQRLHKNPLGRCHFGETLLPSYLHQPGLLWVRTELSIMAGTPDQGEVAFGAILSGKFTKQNNHP
jgi:hypothetical protein